MQDVKFGSDIVHESFFLNFRSYKSKWKKWTINEWECLKCTGTTLTRETQQAREARGMSKTQCVHCSITVNVLSKSHDKANANKNSWQKSEMESTLICKFNFCYLKCFVSHRL